MLDLVAAESRRQDDLRQAWMAATEAQIRHIREDVALRFDYVQELREAETARIDAIRAVDVGAVGRAADVAASQATTLAGQVATSAEVQRNQVAAVATAAATALASELDPIRAAIEDLRRAQYETAGSKSQAVESGLGSRAWLAIAIAAIGAIIAACVGATGILLGVVGVVITLLLR